MNAPSHTKPRKSPQTDTTTHNSAGGLELAELSAGGDIEPGVGEAALSSTDLLLRLGNIQATSMFADIANGFSLSWLQQVKRQKLYRRLDPTIVLRDRFGEVIDKPRTWEGFCRAIGKSVVTVDDQLQNLEAFGEAALESMRTMGVGLSDLKQLRKAPEDARRLLLEAAEKGNKDLVLELAEDLITRNAKRLAERDAKIEDLKGDLAATENLLKVARKVREREEEAEAKRQTEKSRDVVLFAKNELVKAVDMAAFEITSVVAKKIEELLILDRDQSPFISQQVQTLIECVRGITHWSEDGITEQRISNLQWLEGPGETFEAAQRKDESEGVKS